MSPAQSRKNAKPGFTLIELMIVIGIIGLLASTAAYAMKNVQAKRRDVRRASNIEQLQRALSLYIAQAGGYPTYTGCITGADLVSTEIVAKGVVSAGAKLIDPLFPTDIAKCYYYDSASGSKYTLRYTLESNSGAGEPGDHTVTP
ncbi:type II secretion system protein [Candidatus Uhrbacteria bacterium]|nr:type II secretion system protein [Candidatus Uhrbacteria bacterium]